jgi:3-deoxy-D-glycero-D-galacto-nononate 9-phosphate synthase
MSTYIIGEIGQNHNGSVDIAKLIVDLVSRPVQEEEFGLVLQPMNAVKMTKRDLNYELTFSEMERPYESIHSFGNTYGNHRKYLELSDEQHFEVFNYSKEKKLEFVETLCAPSCLSILRLFTPDRLKVASRDIENIPLLHALGETKIPIIVSTGMADKKRTDDALNVLSSYHSNISLLHCVSEYPTHPGNANLQSLIFLKKQYPEIEIGYSDHTIGLSAAVAAVALGAKVIEKHITIDRRMKGTDQAGSLGPDGVERMVRDIRLTELSMGIEDIFVADSALKSYKKLARSLCSKKALPKGHVIREDDIVMLSPGDGLKWIERSQILGRALSIEKTALSQFSAEDFETN